MGICFSDCSALKKERTIASCAVIRISLLLGPNIKNRPFVEVLGLLSVPLVFFREQGHKAT